MGNVAEDDQSWWSDFEAIDGSVIQPKSALKMCHTELNRQAIVYQFLKEQDHSGTFDVSSNLILTQLLGVQVAFSIHNYEAIKKVLLSHHELNKQQYDMVTVTDSADPHDSRTELELFNEFMIVKLYLKIIQSNDITQEAIEEQLAFIRTLLKAINDGKILFQLMQTVFTLVFLRFEHIRKTKRKRRTSEAPSGSISNNINSHTTDVSDTTVATLQTGFVCLKNSLKAVLNSLRLFLMGLDKTEVYKSLDEELRLKFNGILREVDNALWRLRIIDGDGAKKSKVTESVREWISGPVTQRTSNATLQVTSDDENGAPKKKMYRKRLKKRPKLAIGSDENDEASEDPVDFQLVTDASHTDQSESRTQQSRSTESQRKVRSIISKVLMSPESLLTTCMLKGDKESVQRIIKVSSAGGDFVKRFNVSLSADL